MNFLSICSGIEAASVAWEPLGFTPVGYAEIDPFASAVLAYRYGSNLPGETLSHNAPPNFGDFTAIPMDRLPPRVDVLVGGTPCQAFSVAGKRLSLADARGNLTLAYVVLTHELAGSHGLRNAVWENVPGVLSTADNAFGCFLGALVGADDALVPTPKPRDGRSTDFWRWQPAGRFPILDDDGEPTGEFRDYPARHIARWPDEGLVEGPRARAAWRVLDAQYFGLAQRRRRVFVVADFGNGADPAAVLFELQSVSGHSPPRRAPGQGAAGDAAAGVGECGGQGSERRCQGEASGVAVRDFARRQKAFGGGRTSGPVDQASCLTANGGGQAMDFEVETFVVQTSNALLARENDATAADLQTYVAHTLRGDGFDASEDGTGRGTPLVPVLCPDVARTFTRGAESAGAGGYAGRRQEDDANIVAYRTSGNCGAWETGETTDALTTATDPNAHVLAYAIQERAVCENPDAGPDGIGVRADVAYTLEARQNVQAVAFVQNTRDEVRLMGGDGAITGALAAEPGAKQHSYVAVATDEPFTLMERGRGGESNIEYRQDGTANALLTPNGGRGGLGVGAIATHYAVRRLTPLECSRLQGFPDDWSRIPRGNKPAEMCPDGPQYKTYGNSMAVNVMAWIGRRLASELRKRAEP